MNNLSKDINKIIFKYLDYSNNNLYKILETSKKVNFKLKSDISIKDIIFTCAKLGYKGFHVDYMDNVISELDRLLISYKYYEEYDFCMTIFYNINNIILKKYVFNNGIYYIFGYDYIGKSNLIDFKILNLIDFKNDF